VSFSHVLWSTGAVLPVARIAALAHERGALVAVDGAQAAGAIPVSVRELGADAYAVTAQKWLLGPEGMGGAWIAREAWERLGPSFAGHNSFVAYDSRGRADWHSNARRYEASNWHRPSVVRRPIGNDDVRELDYVTSGVGMARRAADASPRRRGLVTPRPDGDARLVRDPGLDAPGGPR
jgi:selenocysteine lyase/cysteine desulfurase